MGHLYYLHMKERRIQNEQYRIVAIVQSSSQTDDLKTSYLAEILELSYDKPSNLYQYDSVEGVNKLLENPLIKEASITKILPGTLYIQYQMRIPVAYVGEYANTAIDSDGVLFPFRSFFTPKRLPIIFLGIREGEWVWGNSLKEHPSFTLAFSILQEVETLKQDRLRVKQLDLSQAQADSFGQRQVVMIMTENGHQLTDSSTEERLFYLRLNPSETAQALANFSTLYNVLFKQGVESSRNGFETGKPVLVDLRIPHLAFLK
jgi:hypothetical protein